MCLLPIRNKLYLQKGCHDTSLKMGEGRQGSNYGNEIVKEMQS